MHRFYLGLALPNKGQPWSFARWQWLWSFMGTDNLDLSQHLQCMNCLFLWESPAHPVSLFIFRKFFQLWRNQAQCHYSQTMDSGKDAPQWIIRLYYFISFLLNEKQHFFFCWTNYYVKCVCRIKQVRLQTKSKPKTKPCFIGSEKPSCYLMIIFMKAYFFSPFKYSSRSKMQMRQYNEMVGRKANRVGFIM